MGTNTCVISKLATDNRWKGHYVHPLVLDCAKRMCDQHGGTTRENIIIIQKRIGEGMTENMDTAQYGKLLERVFEGDPITSEEVKGLSDGQG